MASAKIATSAIATMIVAGMIGKVPEAKGRQSASWW